MKRLIFILLIGLSARVCSAQETSLEIKVTDFQFKPLKGEQVLFVEQTTKNEIKGVSDASGLINLQLPPGRYDIKIKSVGDAEDFSTFEVPKLRPGQTYQKGSMQIQIAQPKMFTLDNLQFDSGKWTIRKSSYAELDELVAYLQLKPDLRIEIGGHTDTDGDEASNLELSQKRADAVKAYLVKKGIDGNRVSAVGYGETSPIADNNSPSGKARNRRTEVRVLS